MTNADKYLKDGVDVYELIRDMTEFYMSGYSYNDNLTYFFNHKVKPNLTEDERVILRNIECFKESYSTIDKIHRTKDGDLYITKFWIDFGEEVRLPYKHLFKFIKPRRRI